MRAMRLHRRPVALLAVVALGATGCGTAKHGASSSSQSATLTTPPAPPAGASAKPTRPKGSHRPDPAALRVIRGWTQAQARGDVVRAASYFSLPALVANPQPLRLQTRAQLLAFNRGLPCGAKLLDAFGIHRLTVATFRLIDRPGASCGQGVGGTASTAFVIRNGKIAQWLRVPDQTAGGPPRRAPSRGSAVGPVI
jgi:hypothetical protein